MVIGLIPGNDIVLGDFKRPYHVCLQLGTDLDFRKEYSLISAMNICSLISVLVSSGLVWSHLIYETGSCNHHSTDCKSIKEVFSMHQNFSLPIYIYIYKMGWLLSIDRRVCAYFYFCHYYPILYLTVTAQSIPFLICIFLVNYKQQLLLQLCQNLLCACATIRLPVLYFPTPSTDIYYGSAAVILCCFGVYQKWTCQKNIYVTWSYRCGSL